MGKYMRKAKITADVAVMEVFQSSLGVCTRARALALQKRLQPSASPPPASSNLPDSSSYLQLRSRRLHKPSLLSPKPRHPIPPNESCSPHSETTPNSTFGISTSFHLGSAQDSCFLESRAPEEAGHHNYDVGFEASFGENNLDFESTERITRESTPCSLIRDVDVATPGSSTRQKTVNVVNRRSPSAILENIPSAAEIDEFFSRANHQLQRQFIDKYNFDVANDMPLVGRYEWVRANL